MYVAEMLLYLKTVIKNCFFFVVVFFHVCDISVTY